MASTITIQNVVDWARTQSKLIPLVGVGGFSNEPALTIANDTLQEMLSFPYNWRFNRVSAASFDTVFEQYEYTENGSDDFGWLESCTIEDFNSTQSLKPRFPIEVVQNLVINTTTEGNPEQIAVVDTNANGNGTGIKYRIAPVPGSFLWRVYPVYQKVAPKKTALTGANVGDWAPFPDELAFVYRAGFLAMAYRHGNDPRFVVQYQIFQEMMQKALGLKDAEGQSEGFYPERPILIG